MASSAAPRTDGRTSAPRVTIAQIAATAGVSTPTVSKVLNGRKGVSPATRALIRELLQEHGYEPRTSQQRQSSGLVEFVIRDLESLWATALLQGAEREAARTGTSLVVTVTHGRPVGDRHWIEHLAARRSDGVVLVVSDLEPGAKEQLARLRLPLVLVDPVGGANPSLPTVAATNWAGGLSATEHLIGLGHRRIGIITGPMELVCSQDRLDGYRAALTRAGLSTDDDLVRHGEFEEAGAYSNAAAHAESLLDMAEPPTAIFAGSDQQAYGVYQVARARGLSIPEDLSVVGFDDVPLCQWVSPPLTTVRQPLAEMAREATRMVLELSTAVDQPAVRRELATQLVVRESTAPPRRSRGTDTTAARAASTDG
ncbi:MAG TPA: LacI family DNA-binding transcriptional regulator [Actinotalea sp.]